MTFTVFTCLIYLGYRGLYTLNFDSPFATLFSVTLYLAEVYGNILMFLYFFQIWNPVSPEPVPPLENAKVDAYIPTYNEEPELLRGTIEAALAMDYPHETYVLDDGNRPEVRMLAEELGAKYLNRDSNIHAKAGNLNHAMEITDGDFIIVFDSDHVAERHFITRTLGYFADDDLAFIQTPHSYYNFDSFQGSLNYDKRYYWEEGQLFYNIVQPGKNHWNAASFCGSAAIFRKAALESVGLIATESITEDMQTGLRLHSKGWKSLYINERLVSGLAAPDLETFSVQRLRWGEGNLGTIFFDNPITMKGLTLPQRLNYLALMLSWTTGVQKLILYYTPLLMLLTGVGPVADMTWQLVAITIFYVSTVWYTVKASGDGYGQLLDTEITQMATFWTQCRGTWRALFNRKSATFVVTQKSGGKRQSSIHDFLRPQYTFIACSVVAITWAGARYVLGVSEDFLGLSICSMLVFFHCVFAWIVIRRALAQRRFDWRHPCAAHIRYELDTANGIQTGFGFTKDLCETGVGFLCYEKLQGHELSVTITAGDAVVTAKGRVCNWDRLVDYESRKDGKVTCYRYGVHFVDLTQDQLRLLWYICTKYAAGRRYHEFDPNVDHDLMDAVRDQHDQTLSVPVRLFRPDTGDIETITETVTNTEFTFLANEDLRKRPLLRAELTTPGGKITGNARVVKSAPVELGQMPLFSYRCTFDGFDGQSRGKLTTLLHLSHEPTMTTVTTLRPEKTNMPVLWPGAIVGTISAIAAALTIATALFFCHDEVLMARAILGKPVDVEGRAQLSRLVSYYERRPTSNERHFLRLRDAVKALNDEDAIARLDETLVKHTFKSPAAKLQQAYALEEMGQVAEAGAAFGELLEDLEQFVSRRTQGNLIVAAARNAVNGKDLKEAVRLYDIVWRKQFRHLEVRTEYAGILAASGAPERALDVLTSDDLSLEDLYLQASLLCSMERYDRARRIYTALAQSDTTDLRAQKGLADVHAWTKEYEKAISGYEAILAQRPEQLETKIALTRALVWGESYRQALQLGKTLLDELNDETELDIYIPLLEAICELPDITSEDQELVMRMFAKRRAHRDEDYFLETLANAFIHCFEPDQAAPLVEQLVSLQPHSQVLHTRYAQVLYRMGDFAAAAEHYEQLIAKGALPLDLRDRGDVLLAAAFNSSRRGAPIEAAARYKMALECYLQLVRNTPSDTTHWPALLDAVAGAQTHSDEVVDCVVEIFNTRASIVSDRRTMIRLADALASAGQDRFALQVLDELLAVQSDTETRWRRANVLLRFGRNAEAEEVYQALLDEEAFSDDEESQVSLLLASANNSELLGNHATARSRYSQAKLLTRERLETDPDQPAIWTSYLSALSGLRTQSLKDRRVVRHIYTHRDRMMEDTKFVERLHEVMLAAKEFNLALPLLEVLSARRPQSRRLQLSYAQTLQATGHLVRAEEEYSKLLNSGGLKKTASSEGVPEFAVFLGAASTAASRGKTRQALALYRRALESLSPLLEHNIEETANWTPYLSALSGVASFSSKQVELVRRIYRNRDLHDNDPDFVSLLGSVLVLAGESDSSIDMLRQASSRFPEHVGLRTELARALADVGEYREAKVYYQWLLDRSEGSVDSVSRSRLLLQAADNCRNLGDRQDAESYASAAFELLSNQLQLRPDDSGLWQPFLDAASGASRLNERDRALVVSLFKKWRQRSGDSVYIDRLTDVLVKIQDIRRAIILLEHFEPGAPQKRLRLAILMKEVGDYERAEIRFRDLLAEHAFTDDPQRSADLLLAAADNAQRLGDLESSRQRYGDALRLLRDSYMADSNAATTRRYLEAMSGAETLSARDRNAVFVILHSWQKHGDPEFRTRLVDVLLKLESPTEALPILQVLTQQEPSSHKHKLRYATALQALKRFDEAERIFRELKNHDELKQSPRDRIDWLASWARNNLAREDYSAARAQFEELFDLTADQTEYNVEYAIALEKTGDRSLAIRRLETSPALTLDQRHLLALMYAAAEDYTKAKLTYQSILAEAPQDLRARRGLADVSFWAKDYETAIDLYQALLSRDLGDSELQESLASALLWSGNGRDALPWLTALVQANPNQQDLWLSFLQAAAATGKLNASERNAFEVVVSKVEALQQEDAAALREAVADCYAATDAHSKAIPLFVELINTSPNARLRAKYADALVGVNRGEEAIPILAELLTDEPNNTRLRWQLANAYVAHEDYESADVHYTILCQSPGDLNPLESALVLLSAANASKELGEFQQSRERYVAAAKALQTLLQQRAHGVPLWQPFLDAVAGSGSVPPGASSHITTIFNNKEDHEPDLQFLLRLCDVLMLVDRYQDSISILTDLAKRHPAELSVQERMASAFLALRQNEAAIPVLKRLVAESQHSLGWETRLASALHAVERFAEAEELFIQLLREPKYPAEYRSALLLNAARNSVQLDELDEAQRRFELRRQEALGVDEFDGEYAGVLLQLGEAKRVIALLGSRPLDVEENRVLAGAYEATGDRTSARRVYQEILLEVPDDDSAARALARIALGEREYAKAIRLYDALLLKHSDDVQLARDKALAHLGAREFVAAAEILQRLLAVDLDQRELWLPYLQAAAGVEPLEQRYVDKSLEIQKELSGQGNVNLQLVVSLSDVLLRAGLANDALRLVKPYAIRHREDDEISQRYANALLASGKGTNAVPLYEAWVTREPTNHDARFLLGLSLHAAHQFESADEQFRLLLRTADAPSGAWLSAAADTAWAMGDQQRADRLFDRATRLLLKQYKNDPSIQSVWIDLLRALGRTPDLEEEEAEAATEIYSKVISTSKTRPARLKVLYVSLARVMVRLGRVQEASRLLGELQTHQLSNPRTRESFAFVLMEVGEYEAAIDQLESLMREEPDECQHPLQLARAHYANERYEAANAYFKRVLQHAEWRQRVLQSDIGFLLSAAHNSLLIGRHVESHQRYRLALDILMARMRPAPAADTRSWIDLLYAVSGVDQFAPEFLPELRELVRQIHENRTDVKFPTASAQRSFKLALANSLARLGDVEASKSLLLELLSADEEDVDARERLAQLLQEEGLFVESAKQYERLVKVSVLAGDVRRRALITTGMAHVYDELGRLDDASRLRDRVLEVFREQLGDDGLSDRDLWLPYLYALNASETRLPVDASIVKGIFHGPWRGIATDIEQQLSDALARVGLHEEAVSVLDSSARQGNSLRLAYLLAHLGRHAEAIQHFEHVRSERILTEGDDQYDDFLLSMARSKRSVGDVDEASELFNAVASRYREIVTQTNVTETDWLSYLNALRGLEQCGENDLKLVAGLVSDAEQFSNNARILAALCDLSLRWNEPTEAMAFIEKALHYTDYAIEIQVAKARGLVRLGEFKQADKLVTQLIHASSSAARDWFAREPASATKLQLMHARIKVKLEDYRAARSLFEDIPQIRQLACLEYAVALAKTQSRPEAIAVLATKQVKSRDELSYLVSLHVEDGNFAKGQRLVATLQEQYPDDVDVERLVANVFFWSREYEQATVRYETLIARFPDDVELREAYGKSLSWIGRYDDAIKVLGRIVFDDRTRSDLWGLILESMAGSDTVSTQHPMLLEIKAKYVNSPIERQHSIATKLARIYLRAGEPMLARQCLLEYIENETAPPEMTLEYADTLASLQRYDQAIRLYLVYIDRAEVRESAVELTKAVLRYADVLHQAKRYTEAQQQLQWVLERVDEEMPARYRHVLTSTARNLVALRRHEAAIERFDQLRELDPDSFHLHEEYAAALLSAGRPEEALEWLSRVAQLSLEGEFLLGSVYSNLQEFDRAVNVYKQIVREEPRQLKGWRLLADAAARAKNYRLSLHIYHQLLARAPNDESLLVATANAYLWSGQHQRALDTYVDILRRSPDRYDLWIALVQAAAGEGVVIGVDAARFLRRIAAESKKWPNDDNFKLGMSNALFEIGEDRRARALLYELLRKSPDDPELRRRIGDSLHRSGRFEDAEQIYSSLLRQSDIPARSSQRRAKTRNVLLQQAP